jgi:hypothetical protein
MIQTDCYFTAAQRPKKNCQDFSICGSEPIPYVIICDGCSSSKNTDVGARILAFAAEKIIKTHLKDDYMWWGISISKRFHEIGDSAIFLAKKSTDTLDLDRTCLDSTLIIAFERDKKVNVFMYGDGDVFSLSKNGEKSIKRISYAGSAPYYLSYLMDKNRHRSYKEFADQMDGFVKTENLDGLKKEVKYDYPTIFSFDIEDLYLLLITSDGAESFVDFNIVEKVSCEAIANELLSIKSKKGEFIKRRSIRLVEDLAKQNTFNTDDFSVGAIMKED